MVLCKFYLDGVECPLLQKCQDEHLDIREFIKSEMQSAINGDQWPLSCFGPFTDKPSIPNYIEDQSFEEIRMLYYDSKNQSFFESCQQFTKAINEAKKKMKTLLTMNNEVMDIVTDLYDEKPKDSVHPKTNPFEVFGPNVFGASVGFAFGNSSSGNGFLTGSQQSIFKQNAFGVQQKPQGTVVFNSSQPQQVAAFGTQQPQQSNSFNSSVAVAQKPHVAGIGCVECKEQLKELSTKMDSILHLVNEYKVALKTQEEEIKFIMNSVKEISASDEEEKSSAPRNVPPLVVKPKRKQGSGKTKNEIKAKIDPLELSVQIDNVTKRNDGSIVIKCKTQESVKKIEKELKQKCAEHYDVKILKLANPRIVVNGIDNEVHEENLIESIKKQNNIDSEMKLIKCFEKGINLYKYNAIIEVNKDLYNTLMEEFGPYFNIGWNKCDVYDNLYVMRCFNCWGFNHSARNCKGQTKCPKCGGDHSGIECNSLNLRCVNCAKANMKSNVNLDARHDARNYSCPVLLKMLEKEKEMIDY